MKFKTFMEQETKGTYAGVRLAEEDSDYIISLCNSLMLPDPISKDEIHITLLYSRKFLPNYVPAGKINAICSPTEFHVFPTFDKKRALVLKVNSPWLKIRHDYLMKAHQATYDYPEYLPHITLSYDIGDMPQPAFPSDIKKEFRLVEEYAEELKLEWKPS